MKTIWQTLRPYIRNIFILLKTIFGFIYNFNRFIMYSGWRIDMKDSEQRNYYAVLVYHALEKSMSYKKRKKDSGWKNAYILLDLLKKADTYKNIGYHDRAAKQVLETFINLPENREKETSKQIKNALEKIKFNSTDTHGVIEYCLEDYQKGVLQDPERFFFSRYSLREFKNETVPHDIIMRAIKLTMKTPSVCNRQPWHLYHTSDQDIKNSVLKYQSGNKPFGEYIPNIIIVTIDLKAFFSAEEHYEYWIDGGMLSMSLIYALHSLGVASCPLNWSTSPSKDKLLRKTVNIHKNHSIMMIIAIGYPDAVNKVCVSARRPIDEIFSQLEER